MFKTLVFLFIFYSEKAPTKKYLLGNANTLRETLAINFLKFSRFKLKF